MRSGIVLVLAVRQKDAEGITVSPILVMEALERIAFWCKYKRNSKEIDVEDPWVYVGI